MLACLCLVLAVLAPADAKDKNPAKELVEKSVKAIGRGRRWPGLDDEDRQGSLTADWDGWGELHANYTRWIRKPDKMKIDQDFTAFDHPFFFTYYYNAGRGVGRW